jgi:hypothetical protein
MSLSASTSSLPSAKATQNRWLTKCYVVFANDPSESNCQNLLNVSESTCVLIAVVHLYYFLNRVRSVLSGTLIATRYLTQSQIGMNHSVANTSPSHSRYSSSMFDVIELLHCRLEARSDVYCPFSILFY